MTVALLPPLTNSCADWDGATVPIFQASRYMRGRNMGRWHRPRCGQRFGDGREIFSFWCGFGINSSDALAVDSVPELEPVCGTCEGRALGAGQDEAPSAMPRLLFEPRWLTPPAMCPGSGGHPHWGLFEDLRRAVGRCLVCQELVGLRANGSRYTGGYGPVRHAPGPGLFAPCPWHAWNHPARRDDGTVGCRCGWREAVPA